MKNTWVLSIKTYRTFGYFSEWANGWCNRSTIDEFKITRRA